MSSQISAQPRNGDGRWASHVRGTTTDLPNALGDEVRSFAFPNRTFSDPHSHLNYYLRETEVPEIVLSNARFAYAEMRRKDVMAAVNAAVWEQNQAFARGDREAVKRAEVFGHPLTGPSAHAAWEEEHAAFERGKAGMELPVGEVERIVRAARTYRASGGFSEADLKVIDDTAIPFGRTGDHSLTIAEIYKKYRGAEWIDESLTFTDLASAKKSDLIIELLQAQLER